MPPCKNCNKIGCDGKACCKSKKFCGGGCGATVPYDEMVLGKCQRCTHLVPCIKCKKYKNHKTLIMGACKSCVANPHYESEEEDEEDALDD